MVAYQVIKVAKAPLLACLTCPLCDRLVEEATTISECLHTFCRECIEQRFTTVVSNDCPICDVYLGCAPMDKLRADPQLDEVRNKLFKSVASNITNKRKAATPLPARQRKERSLSSLGLSSLPSSTARRSSRRITKPVLNRSLVTPPSSSEDKDDSPPVYKRSRRTKLNKEVLGKQEILGKQEVLGKQEDLGKQDKDQSPLEYLANLADADHLRQPTPVKENIDEPPTKARTSASGRYGKLARPTRGVVRKQLSIDCSKSQPDDDPSPGNDIWVALKPSDCQPDEAALPHMSKPYLRTNDGQVLVSTVKKYLVEKLGLKNDAEIELICDGQKVLSSLTLESVRSLWMDNHDPASITGTSGQQLFMTLNYRRKTQGDDDGKPDDEMI